MRLDFVHVAGSGSCAVKSPIYDYDNLFPKFSPMRLPELECAKKRPPLKAQHSFTRCNSFTLWNSLSCVTLPQLEHFYL